MAKQKQTVFMEAYQPCHDAFVRYCSALTYGKMDVEDLVQDVLLSAYTHFEKIEKKNQFLHYLIRAARNRMISFHRKQKYKHELIDKHSAHLRAQGISPEMIIDIQLLYQTLDQLPTKQRDALLLFEISGFSTKEIAELQQSSVTAVKTRLSRGRQQLRKLLAEQPTVNAVSGILKTIKTILL